MSNPNNPFDPSWQRMIDKEYTQNSRPKDSRRDVMIHAAVTLTNLRDNIIVAGEQNQDLVEFRCDFPYRAVPINEQNVRRHFQEMAEKCIVRMRVYGLLK